MEAAYRSRVRAEIDPHSEWVRGNEFDTLIVDVSGIYDSSLLELRLRLSRVLNLFKWEIAVCANFFAFGK